MALLKKSKTLERQRGGRGLRPPFYTAADTGGGRGGAKQSPAVAPDHPRHGIIPYMNMHAQVKNGAGAE